MPLLYPLQWIYEIIALKVRNGQVNHLLMFVYTIESNLCLKSDLNY